MNDEQFFLANAYLDGELTADERRIAEADPDVMSEVEQLRAVQGAVRAVEPPSAEARQSAIDAAMAEFDAVRAAEPGEALAHDARAPIPFRPRTSYARYLGVAAAIVAVGAVGVVLARAGAGDGDDDSAAFDATAEMTMEDGADRDVAMIESAPAEVAADDEAADEDGGESNDTPDSDSSAETAADGDDAPAPESDPTAVERIALPPDFDPEATITDERELGIYGAYLLQQRDLGELGSTPNHSCSLPYPILDETTAAFDGSDTPIYVGVDEAAGFAYAVDPDTCEPLTQGSFSAP